MTIEPVVPWRKSSWCLALMWSLLGGWPELASLGTVEAAEGAEVSPTGIPSAAATPSKGLTGEDRGLGEAGSYQIRVGDVLVLKVFEEPELDAEAQVDQEGALALPLIGRIPVRSLTLEAAREEITRRYDTKYLIHPKLLLTVKTLAPRRYSVLGQVAKAGVFEMPSREKVTLLEAIAMAGGYTRYANQTDVRLRRLTERGEEILRFDARSLASKAGKEVPLIQDGDTITVGESTF